MWLLSTYISLQVSEGIDFTDDKARCVVCVGIPFPNTRDDVVNEKKKFNDEHRVTYRLISGDQWYATQAYRALNQALGRCVGLCYSIITGSVQMLAP